MNYRALIIGCLVLSLLVGVSSAKEPSIEDVKSFVLDDDTNIKESVSLDAAESLYASANSNGYPNEILKVEFESGDTMYFNNFKTSGDDLLINDKAPDGGAGIDKEVTVCTVGKTVEAVALSGDCPKKYDLVKQGVVTKISVYKEISESDDDETVGKSESEVSDEEEDDGNQLSILEYSKSCESGTCDSSKQLDESDTVDESKYDEGDLPWNDDEYNVEDESTKEKIDTFMKFYKAGMTDSDTVEKCLYYLFSKNEKND